MKDYIITIIGATLLGAMTLIISPEKWRSYVRIITGLVIISCIVTPIFQLLHSDVYTRLDESFTMSAEGKDLQAQLVIKELKSRINADIEERLKDEFNMKVRADCSIRVNSDGEVEGVDEIRIYGAKLTNGARLRLCEVYGLDAGGVHDE